jgi:signal transduction histidine kinase
LTLALLAVVLVAWRAAALARRFGEPLRALAESSMRASRGEAFEPPQSDVEEIADLGRRFKAASVAIDERARLEADLRHAQRVATIGTLAGGFAHDVNNQLTVILASLELAKRSAAKSRPIDEDLDSAATAAKSAAELTRSILAFSRRGAKPKKVEVDVNAVVARVARLVASTFDKSHITVDQHLASTLPPIYGDPVLLEQVVMNLAVNARDAMPNGGKLTFATGKREGDGIFFSVTDTGQGIDPEVRERLFEAFFTTKEASKGTGLGLAIARGIVTTHNGRIEIESTPGQGATFTVVLSGAASSGPKPAAVLE